MTHQVRNCRKRLHYPKCSSTIRRLVHETDSNFVVLADEDITKTMNHPMPVRIIRHSSATVVEMEYTRNLKFLREIYADSSSVGSTITDKMQILPSLHISLLFYPFFYCLYLVCFIYVEKMIIQGSLPCLYTIHNKYSVLQERRYK